MNDMPSIDESALSNIINSLPDLSLEQRQLIFESLSQTLYKRFSSSIDEIDALRAGRFIIKSNVTLWLQLLGLAASTCALTITASSSILTTLFGTGATATAALIAICNSLSTLKEEELTVYLQIAEWQKDKPNTQPNINDLKVAWKENDDVYSGALDMLLKKGIVRKTVDDRLQLTA